MQSESDRSHILMSPVCRGVGGHDFKGVGSGGWGLGELFG